MKKTLTYFAIIIMIISCKTKEPFIVKEIISDEMVTIEPDYQNPITKDSIPITIPVELEIVQNISNLRYLKLFFISINNKRLLDAISDHQIYDKQNNKKRIFFMCDSDELAAQKSFNIIIKIRTQMISKKDVSELLKKYNINQSVEDIKIGSKINLVPYTQFRKENPEIVKELKRTKDILHFSYGIKGVKSPNEGKKVKINW
jgi:hypothetical protein